MPRAAPVLLTSTFVAAVAMLGTTTAAHAQLAAWRSVSLAEAIAEPPQIPPSIAELALEHAEELSLADSQRVLLESIRRMQDSLNRPFAAQLAALRPTRLPANPGDLSQEQRDEIEGRRKAIVAIMQRVHDANAIARWRALAALTPEQQERATELENDAQKRAEDERSDRARDAYTDGRRAESQMRLAPED